MQQPTMTDRYGQNLEVGDRVVVATLNYGRAHLREGLIMRFKTHRGQTSAGIRTEAGGNTTVGPSSLVKIPHDAGKTDP
jgi:hypothetical protein